MTPELYSVTEADANRLRELLNIDSLPEMRLASDTDIPPLCVACQSIICECFGGAA